jgi:hypothetical protein
MAPDAVRALYDFAEIVRAFAAHFAISLGPDEKRQST